MPWLVCVFVPLIVLDLQLGIYCNTPRYKVRMYNTEKLGDDKKKQLFSHILFDGTGKSPGAIRRHVGYHTNKFALPVMQCP
jgi:hypothetical protein